jgi:hypothetical protein
VLVVRVRSAADGAEAVERRHAKSGREVAVARAADGGGGERGHPEVRRDGLRLREQLG